MGQDGAEEKLGVVNVASSILDVGVPEGVDGHTVEDGHECLVIRISFRPVAGWTRTYSDNDPNQRRSEEDLDRQLDVRDTEHSPVEAEDGCFAEEEC